MAVAILRRARIEDAKGIHDSHMRSIREICAADYTPEEVNAWGGRAFNKAQRERAIENDFVWVVEDGGTILGHGHLSVKQEGGETVAYVVALYFAPEAKGKGFGAEIVERMAEEARRAGAKALTLESTLTSLEFYRKLGFRDSGPERRHEVNGVGVRCIPMEKRL